MSQSNLVPLDHVMRRILLIKPQPVDVDSVPAAESAERALSLSLMFSGVRCILQYAILPFVLPLIGIATDAARPLLLALTLMAVVSIFFSLRRFWQIGYERRWQYLMVAVAALVVLVAFIVFDLQPTTI